MTFRADSEMGQLRQAIVHRPGLELSRLTPGNIGALLFDDVLWAPAAKEEHDAFAEALRDKGVLVHYYGQLLAETLEVPEGRAFVLDRLCTPEILGPSLAGPVRRLFEDLDGAKLAESLVGGVLKADLHPHRTHSLKWEMLRADDFILPPLPNTLFTRDNSCWMYGGLTVNPMAMPARQRETLHSRAIYRFHPLFAGGDFFTYYGGEDHDYQPATLEGGDVHVIGHGAVLIGMGERTAPMAVETLARALFDAGQASRVVAIELSHSHAFMHLDTVMSMVDTATFVLYPYLDRNLRSWTISPGEQPGQLTSRATTACGTRWPRSSRSTRSRCWPPTRTSGRPSASSGTTAPTTWRPRPGWSSATSATCPPTPCCASTASRSSASAAASSAGAGAGRGA
jgi:arginine deiminase